MSTVIADPTRIAEEFQGRLEGCFMQLEELEIPGGDEFQRKLLALHSEQRGGNFSLGEALAIIDKFQRSLADHALPDVVQVLDLAKVARDFCAGLIIEDLRGLYQWVSGPSPEFTEG